MIAFKKIYGQNFNSFQSFELELFDGQSLVTGTNGGGKSSIFESLIWTLFKRYSRGLNPSYMGKGNCVTGVLFSIDEKEYVVERYFKHSKWENTVKLWINGEEVSHRLAEQTDTEIEKIIGIPHDLFISTCVVQQGIPVNFTTFTPTVRKSMIEESLGFTLWEKIRAKFQNKTKEIQVEVDKVTRERDVKSREMISLNAKVEAMSVASEDKSAEIIEKLKLIKEEALELHNQVESFTESLQDEDFKDVDKIIDNISKKVYSVSKSIRDAEHTVLNKTCATCGTPYPAAKIAEAQNSIPDLKETLNILNEEMDTNKGLQTKVRELKSSLSSTQNLLLSKQRDIASLNAERNKVKSEAPDLTSVKDQLQILVDEVNSFEEVIKEVGRNLEHLSFIDSLLTPSSAFRTFVLEEYLGNINKILELIAPLIFEKTQIKLVVSKGNRGVDIEVSRNGKNFDYRQMSGGQKRRLDIIVILSFQRFLTEFSGAQTNLLVVDEVFDALDVVGIESVIGCLETLFDNKTVYVISHNHELKSRFNKTVEVIIENGTSTIIGG